MAGLEIPFDARQDGANIFGSILSVKSPSQFEPNVDSDPDAASVASGGLLAVFAFAVACLGFQWFGAGHWVPLLDSANLALHEAGHPLVGVFSARATVYGGTLFQLAFPLAAAANFHRAANATGMAACLVWLGENLLNIARYMGDARSRELPLVGNGEHDWTEIFSRWGVLHLDGRIAGMTRGIGVLLVAGAVVWLYRCWQVDRGGSAPRDD